MADLNYIPNGGQTYMPFKDNIHVPQPDFVPLERPQPPLPDFQLTQESMDKGWILASPCQHFLPGVEPEMLDWWWANMEKGYYLWAPASHKRFSWVRSPGEAGFLASSHMISETMVPGGPVFGGDGVQIFRLGLDYYQPGPCHRGGHLQPERRAVRHDHPHVGRRPRRHGSLHLLHCEHQVLHAAGLRAGRPQLRPLGRGPGHPRRV